MEVGQWITFVMSVRRAYPALVFAERITNDRITWSTAVHIAQPGLRAVTVMACPHLFPKQDNLYPETETLYPETETLYPETGDFVAENGNKISCFGIQSFCFRTQIILFRKQVWTGHYAF